MFLIIYILWLSDSEYGYFQLGIKEEIHFVGYSFKCWSVLPADLMKPVTTLIFVFPSLLGECSPQHLSSNRIVAGKANLCVNHFRNLFGKVLCFSFPYCIIWEWVINNIILKMVLLFNLGNKQTSTEIFLLNHTSISQWNCCLFFLHKRNHSSSI